MMCVEALSLSPVPNKQEIATHIYSPSPWKVEAGRLEFKVGSGHVRIWLARSFEGRYLPTGMSTRAYMVKENQDPTNCSVTFCATHTHTHNF